MVPNPEYMERRVTEIHNFFLLQPFTYEEFTTAIHQMHPEKSPGLNGFNPAFYQKFWPLIDKEEFQECSAWLNTNALPPSVNDTNITLIPKIDSPTSMKDFRPISLCNVLYKIVAKVLANRLKVIPPARISVSQSAFVQGRAITDNVLVAFELVHTIKRKAQGRSGDVAFKVDMRKAYDHIRWTYLEAVMVRMGFARKWIDWIMLCVTTVKYMVAINGELARPITPCRGLRKLPPYLFIICAEGLSSLIAQTERRGDLYGCKICRGAPSISHMLFADDSFFFFRSTEREANTMHSLLAQYETESGQAINCQKSGIFFSKNVLPTVQGSISLILGVSNPLNTGHYLVYRY